MKFGWINLFGAGIVILIMLPNIIYAVKRKHTGTKIEIPKYLSICEQIGRYGCIVLMWLPLFVWKFGFRGADERSVYLRWNLSRGFYAKKHDFIKMIQIHIIQTELRE